MLSTLIALLSPSLIFAAPAPTPVAEIEARYAACASAAKDDEAAQKCLDAALPTLQSSLATVVGNLITKLNQAPESRETAKLLETAHGFYLPSRDADCRLRNKVTEGDEGTYRDCLYQADKSRLQQYERFVGFLGAN